MSMQLKSKGFNMIKNINEANGFEAWRQLAMEYEPRVRGRQEALLAQPLKFARLALVLVVCEVK